MKLHIRKGCADTLCVRVCRVCWCWANKLCYPRPVKQVCGVCLDLSFRWSLQRSLVRRSFALVCSTNGFCDLTNWLVRDAAAWTRVPWRAAVGAEASKSLAPQILNLGNVFGEHREGEQCVSCYTAERGVDKWTAFLTTCWRLQSVGGGRRLRCLCHTMYALCSKGYSIVLVGFLIIFA